MVKTRFIINRQKAEYVMLCIYLLFVSLSSLGLNYGTSYIKLDWIGLTLLTLFGVISFSRGARINQWALLYSLVLLFWLKLNYELGLLVGHVDRTVSASNSYFIQYIFALMSFVLLSSYKMSLNRVMSILSFWIILGCIASVIAVIQVIYDDLIIDRFLFIPNYEDNKISRKVISNVLVPTAWFAEASWFGSFLVVPIIINSICLILKKSIFHKKYLDYLSLILLLLGLILSSSLTAIGSVAVGWLMTFLMINKSRKSIIVCGCFGVLIFLVMLDNERIILNYIRVKEIISNLLDYSVGSQYYGTTTSFYVRSVGVYEGISIFSQYPLFGIGIGQSLRSFHSGFVTILAEQGFVGVIMMFLPFVWVLRKLNLARNNLNREQRMFAIVLVVALVADYSNSLITHHIFHLQRWLLISYIMSWLVTIKSEAVKRNYVSNELMV